MILAISLLSAPIAFEHESVANPKNGRQHSSKVAQSSAKGRQVTECRCSKSVTGSSVPSCVNCGVEASEFDSGVGGREAPINASVQVGRRTSTQPTATLLAPQITCDGTLGLTGYDNGSSTHAVQYA